MRSRNTILYLVLIIVILGSLGWLFLWLFIDILKYIFISLVLSSLLRPLTNYISNAQFFKIKVPRFMAVLMSFGIFGLLIYLFVILFIPLISEQVEVLSKVDYGNLYDQAQKPFINLESFLIENELTQKEPGFIMKAIEGQWQTFVSKVKIDQVLNDTLEVFGQFFVGVLAVSFITFFFLYEMGSIRKKFIALIPNRYFEMTIAAYNKIERLLSNYLVGLLIQMLVVFSFAALGLGIFGVKYALTIALFAAIANLIPYLGPILGALFALFVGLSTATDLSGVQSYVILLVKIVSVFGVIQLTDNIVLQPLIFSKSVKAHPLEIFIIIFAGASLAGVIGMIVAIPVYTIIRVSVSELYDGYRSYKVFKIQNVRA